MTLKVSLLSEVLVFIRWRSRSCIYLLFWVSASLLSFHYSLFLSAISLGRGSFDQTFHYQNKPRAWVTRYWMKKLMTDVLMCKPVSSCLFLSLRLTSKTFISSFDHSTVILIVKWKALNVSIDCFKESSSRSQIKKYNKFGSSQPVICHTTENSNVSSILRILQISAKKILIILFSFS